MIHSRTKTEPDPTRLRRAQINDKLKLHGFGHEALGREALRRVRKPVGCESDDYIRRLRELLESLGPVFASFGLYLASRPDVLSLSDCVTLAGISHDSDSLVAESLRQILIEAMNRQTIVGSEHSRIVNFDTEPFESHLLSQLHCGELENGDLVVVKIVHPSVDLDGDFKHLPLIASAVSPRLSDASCFADTVASFLAAIHEQVDCRKVAESLELLAQDTRDNESLRIPKVYHELCSKNVLVTERLDGIRLDHYIANCRVDNQTTTAHSFSGQRMVPDELARLLCDVWLRQVFQGTMLPVNIRPENILLRSPTEIAIVDGSFVSFPAASRRNLLSYFIAVATDEPSKSLACLMKELDSTHSNISQTALDRKFRQLVAFRDGGWEDEGRANCLSDTVFAQWRLAAQSGFQPLRHLTHFYRGTFHITFIARQVAPHRDSLLEGVKDLRLTKLLNDIGTMMEPSYWGGQMDRLASLVILGPQHLDDALKAMSDEKPTSQEAIPTPRVSSQSNLLLISLLVIVTSYAFREQLANLVTPIWAERIFAFVFIVSGGLFLRWMTRHGD